MIYLAVATNATDIDQDDLKARSEAWWNGGSCPDAMKTVAAYRTVGTGGPDIYVIDVDSHDDLHQMVTHWRGIVEFEFHPAFDALKQWRDQGMQIPAAKGST